MARKSQRSINYTDTSQLREVQKAKAERALMMREQAFMRKIMSLMAMPESATITVSTSFGVPDSPQITVYADTTINTVLGEAVYDPNVSAYSKLYGPLTISYEPNVKYEINTWSGDKPLISTIWSGITSGMLYPESGDVINVNINPPDLGTTSVS